MEHVPSTTWRMLSNGPASVALPQGLDAMWHRATGIAKRMTGRKGALLRQAEDIVSMEKRFRHLSDQRLRDVISQVRDRFCLGRESAEDCIRAFAIVREVADRTVGLRPFTVQIAAGLAMASGSIAEMATGEGKTLAATMPAVIAGWRGRGCHVITANEYLAKRDAEWMAPIFSFCGMTVGCIENTMTPAERKHIYNADITYCTSQEAAADFLRDRLTLGRFQSLPTALLRKISGNPDVDLNHLIQRGLECAIVDEADSVLIDEAVTPLIISGAGRNPDQVEAYEQAARLAGELISKSDYSSDKRFREINLTRIGRRRLAELSEPLGGIWACPRRREELVVQALVAGEFFLRDKHYIVDNGKAVIIDEFTGRQMPDRTWRDGLHQAIEAKEGLDVNPAKETYARISFQRFFRLYRNLSGMTGTGTETRSELWQTYRLPVVVIPPRRPSRRNILSDRIFAGAAGKWKAVMAEVHRVHQTGRPILIGTRSVQASENLGRLLMDEGLSRQVLNAVHQDREAQIIAGAGQKGRITVATNMAGRGTDIRLGSGVDALGGLHVIATERHEARRIDRQLFGRCARQGDPGSARAYVSMDDELMRRHPGMASAVLARYSRNTDHEISSAWSKRLVDGAQVRAERASFRQRREVLRTDTWLDEHLGFTVKGL
ncbi:Protein translocase subunit SecA [Olavius algarvensis associated proteobacterium Delta 3]|nr:Protein translocase subunit SecA [Olavius algarvensis associated proteobacterium Delta 3]CAB5142540.1 Protein translocase subunit SecA [Olavius algarvensis associated proteobacterium Delta 3]